MVALLLLLLLLLLMLLPMLRLPRYCMGRYICCCGGWGLVVMPGWWGEQWGCGLRAGAPPPRDPVMTVIIAPMVALLRRCRVRSAT